LQLYRLLFFSHRIKSCLLFTRGLAIVIFKALLLMVKGFRKLKVERVNTNNAFLLQNGLLLIHWRVRNALWVRVNGKWMGSCENQVLVLRADGRRTVTIRIQGLFSSYRKKFDICPQAGLAVVQLRLPNWTLSVDGKTLQPVFSPILHSSIGFTGGSFLPVFPPVAITIPTIPTIQTENQYETRLLHNS
jgi:hypothetical protein